MNNAAERVNVVIPSLGWERVQISVWFAEPGDRVYEGDRLVEVIAGGASFDVPAPATGRLFEKFAFPDEQVCPDQIVGSVIADAE